MSNAQNKTVSVAAAANMQFAMAQLKTEFEKENDIKVAITVGASGKFATQIEEGAPFDVFVSADMRYPELMHQKGLSTGAPKVYASGLLVLWTLRNDLKLTSDLSTLQSPAVKKIAIANPKTAPYGVAAEEVLKYYKVYYKMKDKLVYGESIAQTQQFIFSQAADIGFIAKSIVLSDEMKGKGQWLELPSKSYSPIKQGAVILKHGAETNGANSRKFFEFLFSEKAKLIYKKNGYIVD